MVKRGNPRTLRLIALTFAASLALAACQGGSDRGTAPEGNTNANPAAPAARASSSNTNDTRIAKQIFSRLSAASNQQSESFGGYSRGCMAGGAQLPETGPTWQAMRLSRNRNWAQPITIDFVQDLSRFAASLPGWEGLYVGDMSQPRGGPMLAGHVSHQTGLDVDIWMLPPDRLNLTQSDRESVSSISMRRANGAYTNGNWTEEHMRLLRAAAQDPRTSRILVFPGAKVAMCDWETGDRSWLRKIRPWWGHHYHFHVRLNCPAGELGCSEQDPIPPGDGCADAVWWVTDALEPPDPNAPAPPPKPRRGPITLADLPKQCARVLR